MKNYKDKKDFTIFSNKDHINSKKNKSLSYYKYNDSKDAPIKIFVMLISLFLPFLQILKMMIILL